MPQSLLSPPPPPKRPSWSEEHIKVHLCVITVTISIILDSQRTRIMY